MLLRVILLIALVAACSATSCVIQRAIAVAPNARDSATAPEAAFAIEEAVSRQFGLAPYAYPDRSTLGFTACFGHDPISPRLVLCGKTTGREAQFLLTQGMRARHADSVRLALLDSLRSRFGADAVRECNWHFADDPTQSGCPLLTARTSR
jgi:hypothetical protein